MTRLAKKIALACASPLFGRTRFHGFFSALKNFAFMGMDQGLYYANPRRSGELYSVRALKRLGLTSPVIFDVGAHTGEYARLILAQTGLKPTVYAFEPVRKTFELLEKNLGGDPNVRLCNFGLGEKSETASVFYDKEVSQLASYASRDFDYLGVSFAYSEETQLRSTDDFCAESGIERVNLLKIDVEGYELSVLKGASATLERDAIDSIQFEFGVANIDSRTYFKDFYYLLEKKYRIYRIIRGGLIPISGYSHLCEVFFGTNYLAVHKRLPVLPSRP